MVGVSSPMFLYRRGDAARFFVGHFIGLALAATGLALVLYPIAQGLAAAATLATRTLLAGVLCVTLGLFDVLDKTPQSWRQTPQRYVRTLRPLGLGFVYGIDVGLLVSTQKVTSLLWAAIVGVTLVSPELLLAVLYGVVAVLGLSVFTQAAFLSPLEWSGVCGLGVMRAVRIVRLVSGSLLITCAGWLLIARSSVMYIHLEWLY